MLLCSVSRQGRRKESSLGKRMASFLSLRKYTWQNLVNTQCPRAKWVFLLGSDRKKYTNYITFEGSFEILRCGHFDL